MCSLTSDEEGGHFSLWQYGYLPPKSKAVSLLLVVFNTCSRMYVHLYVHVCMYVFMHACLFVVNCVGGSKHCRTGSISHLTPEPEHYVKCVVFILSHIHSNAFHRQNRSLAT